MLLTSERYPVTVVFCIIWSIIALFFVVLDVDNLIRIILSLPLIVFIPGYLLVYALFPERTEKVFDVVDRIALGVGISIAIVPLIGLVLNYSPWGLDLQPILFSLEAFILIIGAVAVLRWYRTPAEKRYAPKIDISFPSHETSLDKALTLVLIICIIVTACLVVYVVLSPKQGERFTEFYILGPTYLASDYPLNLTVGENATVILGVANYENMLMNYTIEVWLSNQTTELNMSSNANETIYHNLWFMDKITVTLPHQPINIEEIYASQWEYEYRFSLAQTGQFKLVFLLYTTQVYHYSKNQDYKNIAVEKVDSDHTTAYRSLHLWIDVV